MRQSSSFVPLDGRLSLDALVRLAAEFDAIEPDAAYPAAEFVVWLRREQEHRLAVELERTRRVDPEGRRSSHREYMRRWRSQSTT
jgi:hypothetical protein